MGKRQQIDHHELQCERPPKNRKISEVSDPQPGESSEEEEIKEEFVLTKEIADSAILTDITGNFWRIGKPVGKGSFGEIFLASDQINQPVDCNTAKYVAKIEPHSNGPLFVEIHCLLNVNKRNEDELPVGIPEYIASGSHYFIDSRYRFLVLPRFKCDLHSIIKNGRISQEHFLIAAHQIIGVLQNLHNKGYVHSDIKAENIMIGLCKNFQSRKQMTTCWETPVRSNGNGNHKKQKKSPSKELPKDSPNILYGGSNPIRACRLGNQDSNLYQDMLRSHYLRPSRSVSYVQNLYSDDESVSDEKDVPVVVSPRKYEMDNDFECKVKVGQGPKLRGRPRKYEKPEPEPVIAPPPSPPKRKRGRKAKTQVAPQDQEESESEDNVYLIDYGLATKYLDTNGEHRPFCQDQRRAHDGTLEFTSRDAHFGAHSRRSDLECLGFNLIYWSQGYLPWKDENMQLQEPDKVHRLKEIFMTDVREMMKLFYGKDVPKLLMDFMCYVGELAFEEEPDYDYLKGLFENELKVQFATTELKLNLKQVREACEPLDKDTTETELMMDTIKDLKTVRQLGFLSENSGDPDQPVVQVNPTPTHNKYSPKNLRSKVEKVKGRKSKRATAAANQKESTSQKLKSGKRLNIVDIVNMDTDLIARDRAEKEYDRIEEKLNDQTPQRYKGRPTYAILEIENRLKIRNSGLYETEEKKEVIKGYNKPMMDVLRKKQFAIEPEIRQRQESEEESEQEVEEEEVEEEEEEELEPPTPVRKVTRGRKSTRGRKLNVGVRRRGRPSKRVQIELEPEVIESEPEVEEEVVEEMVEPSPKVTRSRSRKSKYYRDNEFTVQTDESSCSSTSTVATVSSKSTAGSSKNVRNTRRTKAVSESSGSGCATRNQNKSRSTSRSTIYGQTSEQEEEIEDNENESDNSSNNEESDEEQDDNVSLVVEEDLESNNNDFEYESSNGEPMEDDDAEDSDDGSIYIKYSPLKTRHARKNASKFNLRGRRIFNDKDFRSSIPTRG